MAGPQPGGGDPRLIWSVWADETAKAAGDDEAAGARRHRNQDKLAAEERAGRRPGLLTRVVRFFRRSRG